MTNDNSYQIDSREVAGVAREVFARGRASAVNWQKLPTRARVERIGRLRREIVARREEIAEVTSAETGKTHQESMISSLLPTLEMLLYLENEAPDIMSRSKVSTPMIYRNNSSFILYKPRGVVLVIAPWNNPFQLCLIPVAMALASGNTVVLKPSEETPETGELVGELCGAADLPVEVVNGGPELGKQLVEEEPDMILFTGGVEAGRKVMAAAASRLIPVILELGGNDPMLVFEDARLERAARGAAYGAFAHAGQHCISVKRLLVQTTVYDEFLDLLSREMRSIIEDDNWGRVRAGRAQDQAKSQVRDALSNGARLILPEDREGVAEIPTLVADADPAMDLMRKETFAPVLATTEFKDVDEAVRNANDSPYGLNASVWSQDRALCERVIGRLETGNVYVNNVLTNVGNPYLPFGGVKQSGLGRYHGKTGLHSFCDVVSVMMSRNRAGSELNWFPHDDATNDMVNELLELRYGDLSWMKRLFRGLKLLPRLMRGKA
ncbi:MAG: aldehyde dehydrogenase family protein [Planctomycetes bacterium]|nr:aldehyde dehydrogenase family protein [Planctomycetota bacterium]